MTPSLAPVTPMTAKPIPTLNQALGVARLYWGFSQAELAESLGVSQAMVSELERGSKSVTLEMLDRYSKVLGLKKSQLLFFAEEMEGHEPIRRGRLIVAEKALSVLRMLQPKDTTNADGIQT